MASNASIIPSLSDKQKVIAVVGPTSAGKTALSILLAKKVDGEIISADSRQVYRGLTLGSGKITKEEMNGIPHYMLDIADPKQTFTASDYAHFGRERLLDMHSRNKVPIVVGGTGFYIDALLGRVSLAEVPPNPTLREQLADYSAEQLQGTLQRLDPKRFETIDRHNPHRLVRAIEIALKNTKDGPLYKAQHTTNTKDGPLYEGLWIGLTLPWDELKEKICQRLVRRFEQGMLEEAKQLYKGGLSFERMEQLGLEYRFMSRHLRGSLSYEKMLEELKKETLHYAKRQMTWFKKNKDIQWYSPENVDALVARAEQFLRK